MNLIFFFGYQQFRFHFEFNEFQIHSSKSSKYENEYDYNLRTDDGLL